MKKVFYLLVFYLLFLFPKIINAQVNCNSAEYVSEIVSATFNDTVAYLGDEIELSVVYSAPLSVSVESVIWSVPKNPVYCSDCFSASFTAVDSTNISVTITFDNGCTLTNSMPLHVINPRRVYVPNVFSPDQNGVNEVFMIYADEKTVDRIESFEIFSRKGHRLFDYFHFEPNNPAYGWDGSFRWEGIFPNDSSDGREKLNSETYVWKAVVRYINDEVEAFTGDVTLMR